jgi:hypothetical protein
MKQKHQRKNSNSTANKSERAAKSADPEMEGDDQTVAGQDVESKRRSPADKRKKFKDLAEIRVPKAAWSIRNIGKLANTYAYEFESKDIAKIISHLRKELDEMESRFDKALNREARKFSLD